MDEKTVIKEIIAALKHMQELVDRRIIRTPTGDRRNAYCDMNIHLLACIQVASAIEENTGE